MQTDLISPAASAQNYSSIGFPLFPHLTHSCLTTSGVFVVIERLVAVWSSACTAQNTQQAVVVIRSQSRLTGLVLVINNAQVPDHVTRVGVNTILDDHVADQA